MLIVLEGLLIKMENKALISGLKSLKELREEKAVLGNTLLELRKQFDEENVELIQKIKASSDQMTIIETLLRDTAVDFYKANPESKKLDGGIGIRVNKNLVYDDKEALSWAKEHSLCLKLDASAFKKIAKTEEIDFVKIEEVVSATIPSKIELTD